eukprot:Em0012g736a
MAAPTRPNDLTDKSQETKEDRCAQEAHKNEWTQWRLDNTTSLKCEVESVVPKHPIPCSSVRKEELSSTSIRWTQPPEQSMQRGNSHVCLTSVQASEDHQVMAEQLAVYKSDLEKEHAQQEKLLKENEILKSEKDSLEQEMNSMAARLQQLIIETETTKQTASRKIKQLESQLYSSLEASRGVAELEGTLSEQNTRLQEYYAHMEEQNNTIRSLERRVARNQLKVEIKGCRSILKEYEDQCESLLRDLALKTDEMTEAQRQHAESYKRLQQTNQELELESEISKQLRNLEEQINQWREKYENEKETSSRKVKQLESQLYSSQEASRGVAELEGTLIEQNTRLQEYYAYMDAQNNTITSLESRVARNQGVGESIAEYVTELRRLSTRCKFDDCLEQVLRDRLVCWLRNEGTRKRLLSEADLTLAKELELAQGFEAAEKNAQKFKETEVAVHLVAKPKGVYCQRVKIEINGRPVTMEVDTGATVSLISEKNWKDILSGTPLKMSSLILQTYTAKQKWENVEWLPSMVTSRKKGHGPSLLDHEWLRSIQLSIGQVTVDTSTKIEQLLQKYGDVFREELGQCRTSKLN